MSRTRMMLHVAVNYFLIAAITVLSLPVSSWAAQPYLDDSNKTVPAADGAPSVDHHRYPRMYHHGNFGNSSAQALSKYDFLNLHGVDFDKAEAMVGFAPDTMILRHISGREYQGYTQNEPCYVSMGVAFVGTGPVSQGGPQSVGCNIYAGHWLYKAGSPLSVTANSSILTLQVADAGKFEAGQYVVIYDAPAGSFRNAEHALVTGRNVSARTLTLQSRGYKSNPTSHAAGSIVAQHVLGQGTDNRLWAFNFSSKSPIDANGRTWGSFYAEWLAKNHKRYKNGMLANANVVGIVFDTDFYFELLKKASDANNDLVTDNGLSGTGVNWLGDGLDQFYELLASKIPDAYLVTGVHDARGYASAQGNEMENWLDYGNGDFKANPQYKQLNSLFATYLFNSGARMRGSPVVHNLTKTPTKLYPGSASPTPPDNRPFRLGLALALMENGYFGTHSRYTPDAWWDEYAVDVTANSPDFGKAVSKTDVSGIYQHRGWLGRPTGKFARIYNDSDYAANLSLVQNGTFDTSLSGWSANNVSMSRTVSGPMDGAGAIWLSPMNSYQENAYSAEVRSDSFSLTGGTGYTVAFSARAAEYRDIVVSVGTESAIRIPVGPKWRRYVLGFHQKQTQSTRLRFQVGKENSEVWLDSVYLFRGNANVFRRDFEHGVVLANATPESKTINVGSGLRRIKGTQDPAVNGGQAVTSITLAPYDGILLLRTSASTTDTGTDPDSGTGTGTDTGNGWIGDYVWLDADKDGMQDADEAGLGGIQLQLLDCNGVVLASQTSAANGSYSFDKLAVGNYRIKVVPPAGAALSPAYQTPGPMDSNVSTATSATNCLTIEPGQVRSWVDVGITY